MCAETRPLVARMVSWVGATLVDVDVEADPETAVDFGLRIPVVRLADGPVLAEGNITAWPLLKSLVGARMRKGLLSGKKVFK